MTNTRQARLKNLGEVEQIVMDYIWTHGPSSSEACREALASSRPMKDSTIRTVLRRLEEKGYLKSHLGGATETRGGRDKRLYTLTHAGIKVLNQSKELRNAMYKQVPRIVWGS